MAKNYIRNIPDFEYVNRTKDGQFISNYTQVKNFFKKGKIREDLFQDLTVFEKYKAVLVRPDKYTYGGVEDISSLSEMIESLEKKFSLNL